MKINWLKWFRDKVIYEKDGFVITEKRNGDWIIKFPEDIVKSLNLYPGKNVYIISESDRIIIKSELEEDGI